MKKTIFALLSVLIGFSAQSQQKKLTIEESVYGKWRKYATENRDNIEWKDNLNFTYLKDWTEIVNVNSKSNQEEKVISLKEINSILKSNQINAINYVDNYKWLNKDLLKLETTKYITIIDVLNKKLIDKIELKDNAKNISYHDKSNQAAFTVDNNLFVSDNKGNKTSITNESNKGIVSGDAYVHRQEFGINNGIFWSPSGSYLAFYQKDETMVSDYPLVDVTSRIASLKNTKYPMAGETSEQVKLGIYNFESGKTIFIKPQGAKDDYLTRITWDPSEDYIYIAELNRGQNHMKLNKFNAKTGEYIATLFEEKHEKYVEPEHDMIFMKTKPNQFLWFSERDGYQHLYLYNTDGKMLKQLTKGEYIITDFMGFDKKEENFYAMTTMASPLGSNLYKFNIKNGKSLRLTNEDGQHVVTLSKDKNLFVDNYSNSKTPRIINLVNNKGKILHEIVKAENPLKDHNLGEMNIGKIKAADGKTDLYYRMIKPGNFDPSKKYPVIVYVYGGPHAQLVTDSWLGGTGLWDFYMAQEGYIMFTLDNRGSANRGFDFENVIHRQCGQEEMKDQMKGIEYLKSLPFIDQDRIGVSGWSYGGFMTISLMTNYPETFKVGTAGGPVTDWKYYEVMYGERYMDTPQENPEGYKKTSLLNKAEDLKGKLLIIHGGVDPVVVWQHSQDFVNKCIEKGVLLDYFVYPNHEHNVRGKDRIHLMRKITQYFDDYLK